MYSPIAVHLNRHNIIIAPPQCIQCGSLYVPQCMYYIIHNVGHYTYHSVCIYTMWVTIRTTVYVYTQCGSLYVPQCMFNTLCSSLYTVCHSVCIIHNVGHYTQCATVYVYTQCSSLYTMCHSVCIYTVQFTVHNVPQCMYIHSVVHCTQCATVYV